MFPKSGKLLSVKLSSTSLSEVLKVIESNLKNKRKLYISTPNPEIVLAAQSDKKLLESLNRADIALPDGVGLLWAAKRLKMEPTINRIPGRMLVSELFALANRKKYKIFVLGGTVKVNKKTLLRLKRDFPKLKTEGTGEINVNIDGTGDEDREVISKINSFRPHILLVAFGAPKQEKWITRNLKKINAGVFMTIGGTLDYFVGNAVVPPRIIARIGLEWLWRLLIQPSRFPRIFNAVVRFPILVLRS